MKSELPPLSEDERIFNKWYEEFFSTLYRYALPKLWFDESLAADCVHEVFDIAKNKVNALKHHSNISAWLFKALKYRIAKQYRKEKLRNEKQRACFELSMPLFTNEHYMDDQLVSDEEIFSARDTILDTLTDKERELHRLYYVEHMTLKEICSQLGISKPAAKTRLFRLRNKIHDRVTKEFGGHL